MGKILKSKINLYFYGDVGLYDDGNPAYISNSNHCKEILYLIAANDKYTFNLRTLSEVLELEQEMIRPVIHEMLKVNLISEHNGHYKMEFTCFVDSDIPKMIHCLKDCAVTIANKIKDMSVAFVPIVEKLNFYEHHDLKRWLYHIIGDSIFDDTAFDYFEQRGVFKTSKAQYGNRNYIAYGFQDSEQMEELSNKMLCSSNNYKVGNYIFNSFGDSDGNRLDFFRLNKQINQRISNGLPNPEISKIYLSLMETHHKNVGIQCAQILEKIVNQRYVHLSEFNSEELLYIEYLEKLNYITIAENIVSCIVPVFIKDDMVLIHTISEKLLGLIYPDVINGFDHIFDMDLSLCPLNHEMSREEISIELWHQLFGLINEELIRIGLISNPKSINGEGRYLRCFYILNE